MGFLGLPRHPWVSAYQGTYLDFKDILKDREYVQYSLSPRQNYRLINLRDDPKLSHYLCGVFSHTKDLGFVFSIKSLSLQKFSLKRLNDLLKSLPLTVYQW
jgi:hypothetical protein